MTIKNSKFIGRVARWSLLLCFLGAPTVACSGSDDPAETEAGDETGEASKSFSAADGGTLEDVSGKATLDVPGGSLEADVEITVTTSESDGETVSSIFDFGPDGLTFDPPATLSIEFSGDVPEGKKAVLATYVDGSWMEIAGSSLVNGMVSGQVDHFSKFAIILVDGEFIAVSECADIYANFEACGGDLTGTYVFGDFCFDPTTLGDGGPADCVGFSAALEFDFDIEITITATEFQSSGGSQTITSNTTYPLSCLGGATCDDVSDPENPCTTVGDVCECAATQIQASEAAADPYTTSGNTLTIDNGDGTSDEAEYCVKGNTVELKILGDAASGDPDIVYTLVRN